MARSTFILLLVAFFCSAFTADANSDLDDLEAEIALTEKQEANSQVDEDLDVIPYENGVDYVFDDESYSPIEYEIAQRSTNEDDVDENDDSEQEVTSNSEGTWGLSRHWSRRNFRRNRHSWRGGRRNFRRNRHGWRGNRRNFRRNRHGWRGNRRNFRGNRHTWDRRNSNRNVNPPDHRIRPQVNSRVKCQSGTFVGGYIDPESNYVYKTIRFSPAFKKTPTVLTGIQKLESSSFYDQTIEINVVQKTPSFMSIKISTMDEKDDLKDLYVNWMACA